MEIVENTITAIKALRRPGVRRAEVFVNGVPAFSLDAEVVVKEQLKVGQVLSAPQLDKLRGEDAELRCLNAAYQFLSARPRSRNEVIQRLSSRGFSRPEIDQTLLKLTGLHLVDDAAFADYWKENRLAFRPRSRYLVKQELRAKGVEPAVIDSALQDVDENAAAYQAARVRAGRLNPVDFSDFSKKIGGFLQRRGFGYATIKTTVDRLWREKTGENPEQFEQEAGSETNPETSE